MRKRPASRLLLNIMWISKKRPRAKERGRSSVRDSHALRIQVHRPNTQVFYRLATFLEPVCFCAIIVTCNKTTHSCPRSTWKSTPSCLFRNHSPSSTGDAVDKGRALLPVHYLFPQISRFPAFPLFLLHTLHLTWHQVCSSGSSQRTLLYLPQGLWIQRQPQKLRVPQ